MANKCVYFDKICKIAHKNCIVFEQNALYLHCKNEAHLMASAQFNEKNQQFLFSHIWN